MYSVMIDKYYELYDMAYESMLKCETRKQFDSLICKFEKLTRDLHNMYRLNNDDKHKIENIMMGDIVVLNELYKMK